MESNRLLAILLLTLVLRPFALAEFEQETSAANLIGANIAAIEGTIKVSDSVGYSDSSSVEISGQYSWGYLLLDLPGPGVLTYWKREDESNASRTVFREGEWEFFRRPIQEADSAHHLGIDLRPWPYGGRQEYRVFIDDIQFEPGWGLEVIEEGGSVDTETISPPNSPSKAYKLTADVTERLELLYWDMDVERGGRSIINRAHDEPPTLKIAPENHTTITAVFGEARSIPGGGKAIIDSRLDHSFDVEELDSDSVITTSSLRLHLPSVGKLRFYINGAFGIGEPPNSSLDYDFQASQDGWNAIEVPIPKDTEAVVITAFNADSVGIRGLEFEQGEFMPHQIIGAGSVSETVDRSGPIKVSTLTAVPEEGWEFVSWEGDASSKSPVLKIGADSTKLVTARFARPPVETGSATWHFSTDSTLDIVEAEGKIELYSDAPSAFDIAVEIDGPSTLTFDTEATRYLSFEQSEWLVQNNSNEGIISYELEIPSGPRVLRGSLQTIEYAPPGTPFFSILNIAVDAEAASFTLPVYGDGDVETSSQDWSSGYSFSATATPGTGAVFSGWRIQYSNGFVQDWTQDSNLSKPFLENLSIDRQETVEAFFGERIQNEAVDVEFWSNGESSYADIEGIGKGFVFESQALSGWMGIGYENDKRPSKVVARARYVGPDVELLPNAVSISASGEYASFRTDSDWQTFEFVAPAGDAIERINIYDTREQLPDQTPDTRPRVTEFVIEEQFYSLGNWDVEGATVTATPNKEYYSKGESVRVSVVPDYGYEFIGWTGLLSEFPAEFTTQITGSLTDTPIVKPRSDFGGARLLSDYGRTIHRIPPRNDYEHDSINVSKAPGYSLETLYFETDSPGVLAFVTHTQNLEILVNGRPYPFQIARSKSAETGKQEIKIPVDLGINHIEISIKKQYGCESWNSEDILDEYFFDNVRFHSAWLLDSQPSDGSVSVSPSKDFFQEGERATLSTGAQSEDGEFSSWSPPYQNEKRRFELEANRHVRIRPHYNGSVHFFGEDITYSNLYYDFVFGSRALALDGGLGHASEGGFSFSVRNPRYISFNFNVISNDPFARSNVRVFKGEEIVAQATVFEGSSEIIEFYADPSGDSYEIVFDVYSEDSQAIAQVGCFESINEIPFSIDFHPNSASSSHDGDTQFVGTVADVALHDSLGEEYGLVATRNYGARMIGEALPSDRSRSFVIEQPGRIDFERSLRILDSDVYAIDPGDNWRFAAQSEIVFEGDSAMCFEQIENGDDTALRFPAEAPSVLKLSVYLLEEEYLYIDVLKEFRETKPTRTIGGEEGWYQVSIVSTETYSNFSIYKRDGDPRCIPFDSLSLESGYGFDYTIGPNLTLREHPDKPSHRKGDSVDLELIPAAGYTVGWFSPPQFKSPIRNEIAGTGAKLDFWKATNPPSPWDNFEPNGNLRVFEEEETLYLALNESRVGASEVTGSFDGPGLFTFDLDPDGGSRTDSEISVFVNGVRKRHWINHYSAFKASVQLDKGPQEVTIRYENKLAEYFPTPRLSNPFYIPGYSVLLSERFQNGDLKVYPSSTGLEIGQEILAYIDTRNREGVHYKGNLDLDPYGFGSVTIEGNIEITGGYYSKKELGNGIFGSNSFDDFWFGSVKGPGVIRIPLTHSFNIQSISLNGKPIHPDLLHETPYELVVMIPEGHAELEFHHVNEYAGIQEATFAPGYAFIVDATSGNYILDPELDAYQLGDEVSVIGLSSNIDPNWNIAPLPNTNPTSFSVNGHTVIKDSVHTREIRFSGQVFRTPLNGWTLELQEKDGIRRFMPTVPSQPSGGRSWIETTVQGPISIHIDGVLRETVLSVNGTDYPRDRNEIGVTLPQGQHTIRITDGASRHSFISEVSRWEIDESSELFPLLDTAPIGILNNHLKLNSEADLDQDGLPKSFEDLIGTSIGKMDAWLKIVNLGSSESPNFHLLYEAPERHEFEIEFYRNNAKSGEHSVVVEKDYEFYEAQIDRDSVHHLVPISQFGSEARAFRVRAIPVR